jgi:hypothetical protein
MAEDVDYQKVIHEDIKQLRQLVSRVVNYIIDAESEVPEKMRRFVMYMHDMHDVKNLYDEHGIPVPEYVMREVERCDDRLRQLLVEMHTDGGAFEKVRRDMAKDTSNRWDHTRRIEGPKGEVE